MAEIPVNFLLEKLSTLLVKEAQLLGGMGGEIGEIREELESIQAFLKDADRRKNCNAGIKIWVQHLRRVAYDVEDAIDQFAVRFGRRNEGGGIVNTISTLLSAMGRPFASHDLAKSIQEIKGRLKRISERRLMYGIELIEEGDSSEATIREWQGHREAKFLDEAEVVGMKEKVDFLMDELVRVAGNDKNTFISVYGMGGVGKSTLVRKVYNDPNLKKHFNCFAWLSVSQSFKIKDLLKFMLIEFGSTRDQNSGTHPSKREMEEMNEIDLKKKLVDYLQGKRFVLVLDDVWDKSVCVDINLALPENSNGSKIMITTRKQSLASELEGTGSINTKSHELKPLGDEAARELLCRKAFDGCAMPSEFEDVCKSMLQRCGGLPLAIVTLGGILRKKGTVSEWKKVHDNLRELLGNHDSTSKGSNITSILKLSYNELPLYLKPCFLYCGLFPEDHLIKRNKLIRLWIAEGFIEERSGRTMEEVGEDYLMQLVGRSMLQTADASIDGRVKSCRVHDLMRDLAVSVSQEEEFWFKLETQIRQRNVVKPRRMCVIGENEVNGISSTAGIQHLRSLLFFDVQDMGTWTRFSCSGNLPLLRVLDLEDAGIVELPKQIGQLLHLRYLSLKENIDLVQLPRSIGRLQNLETLDIRNTTIRKVPRGITKLKNLRHLCVGGGFDPIKREFLRGICNLRCLQTLFGSKARTKTFSERWYMAYRILSKPMSADEAPTEVPRGICNLRSLQTLIGVSCPAKGMAADIKYLQLKRLDITLVDINRWATEEAQELCKAICGMRHLVRLKVSTHKVSTYQVSTHGFADLPFGKTLLEHPPPQLRMLELDGLSQLPLTLGSFYNLIRLTLSHGSLTEDPFPSLSSLPSLDVLHLLNLKNLKSLQCSSSGFSQLKELKLGYLRKLEEVIFVERCMPSLKQLCIEYCRKLKMVPPSIQHLQLGELVMRGMADSFVKRLEEGGEDRCKVQHIPIITVENGQRYHDSEEEKEIAREKIRAFSDVIRSKLMQRMDEETSEESS